MLGDGDDEDAVLDSDADALNLDVAGKGKAAAYGGGSSDSLTEGHTEGPMEHPEQKEQLPPCDLLSPARETAVQPLQGFVPSCCR